MISIAKRCKSLTNIDAYRTRNVSIAPTLYFLYLSSMKVTAILKGMVDQYGRQPIQIRMTNGHQRKFRPTHIKVEPTQFENGKVTNHPQAKQFNDVIKRYILQVESAIILNKHDAYASKKDLFVYIKECLSEWDRSKEGTTIKKYWSELNKLKEFSGPVELGEITAQWLNRYRAFLYQRMNSENTIWSSFKFLRLIIRKAHLEKKIQENPFDVFAMPKYKDPKKVYLSRDQIDLIENYLNSGKANEEEVYAGTWFLIACYTGLRFSDLTLFNKEKNIKDGRIVLYTHKTDELISMPLSDKLRGYFERIEYKPLYYVNVHYNRLIKSISGAAGIDEHVSSHTARHTFGTLAATVGISQEVTAKLLGHRSLKTTNIYYRIVNSRIDMEVSKMQL
jgi:integrase